MGQCSICKNPEIAQTVNELLYAKQGLDEIAQATSCHRSSIFRHKVNPRCYLAWKAARLKAKSNRVDISSGRLLVLWPAGHSANGPRDGGDELCTYFDAVNEVVVSFDLADRQPNDVLFRVQFEKIGPVKNPDALKTTSPDAQGSSQVNDLDTLRARDHLTQNFAETRESGPMDARERYRRL